jgi:hypothetical protein
MVKSIRWKDRAFLVQKKGSLLTWFTTAIAELEKPHVLLGLASAALSTVPSDANPEAEA